MRNLRGWKLVTITVDSLYGIRSYTHISSSKRIVRRHPSLVRQAVVAEAVHHSGEQVPFRSAQHIPVRSTAHIVVVVVMPSTA